MVSETGLIMREIGDFALFKNQKRITRGKWKYCGGLYRAEEEKEPLIGMCAWITRGKSDRSKGARLVAVLFI